MTWLVLAVRFGGLAVLLPIALLRLDVSEFLVWQILSAIATFTGLADFGLQPTFARLIAFTRAGNPASQSVGSNGPVDPSRELSKLLTAQRRMYVFASMAAAAGVFACGFYFLRDPIDRLTDQGGGWAALAVTSAAALVTVQGGAKSSALLGFNLIATMRTNELVVTLAQLGFTALVVLLTGDLLLTVLCYSLWSVPLFLLNDRRLAVAVEEAGANFRTHDKDILPLVWSASWRSGIGIAMSLGAVQMLALVTTRSEPVAQAASQLLVLRLVTALSQVAQAPFYSRLPLMAGLKGAGDGPGLVDASLRGMRLAHWTYVLGAAALLAFLPAVLGMTGAGVSAPPVEFTAALLLAFFVERYVGMHMQVYSLTGHILWHKLNFAVGATAIASCFVLLPLVGALAFPISLLLGNLAIGAISISTKSVASLGQNWVAYEKRASLLPTLVLLLVCSAVLLVSGMSGMTYDR